MIELRDVVKRYGRVVALDGVSFRVEKGEWVSVMGPSGSGKSTLLNLIAGLDTPTSGRVYVDNAEVSAMDAESRAAFRRSSVGMVFQQFHLIPYLTALENVMLAQYVHSMPDREEALLALERVGMRHRAEHLSSRLSGGEQQRVAIARALVNDPKVILADEPTGSLDAENEREVLRIFRELAEEGRTLLVVTHNSEVAEAGDRTVRIHHGRLEEVQQGM